MIPNKAAVCDAFTSVKDEFNNLVKVTYDDLDPVQTDLLAQALRLGFHDAGEYDKNTLDRMGPDGCLSHTQDNINMHDPEAFTQTVFEAMWQKNCDKISRADFYALIAKVAVEYADRTGSLYIRYQYGRHDNTNCSEGAGRLPGAELGLQQQMLYYERLGLTKADGVTLSGGHSIGHVHRNSSGYGFRIFPGSHPLLNAWDRTPNTMDNRYYDSIINIAWANIAQTRDDDKPISQNIWVIARGIIPNIMLNSDMVLGFDISLNSTPNCPKCGVFFQNCGNPDVACSKPEAGFAEPDIFDQVKIYADRNTGNKKFLDDFGISFAKLMSVGYGMPADVDGATAAGKLGTLTALNFSTCNDEEEEQPPEEEPPLCMYASCGVPSYNCAAGSMCLGKKTCEAGTACIEVNDYYAQCREIAPNPLILANCARTINSDYSPLKQCSKDIPCCNPSAECGLDNHCRLGCERSYMAQYAASISDKSNGFPCNENNGTNPSTNIIVSTLCAVAFLLAVGGVYSVCSRANAAGLEKKDVTITTKEDGDFVFMQGEGQVLGDDMVTQST